MQESRENNFLYEERNENFPDSAHVQGAKSTGIGKIIARYRNKHPQQSELNKKEPHHHHHVSTVSGLNYSQIYNELKINKPNPTAQDYQSESNHDIANKRGQAPQSSISRAPFNFQSAMEIRNQGFANRKVLPGIILHTPKNADTSFYSREQQEGQQVISKRTKLNRGFRISEVKDKHQKKSNINELSDLSINGFDPSQAQLETLNRSAGPKTDRTNSHMERSRQRQNDNKLDEKVKEQKPLANSRSIGVGNHRIEKKDLQGMHQQSDQNSPDIPVKGTPRYQKAQESGDGGKKIQYRYTANESSNPQKIETSQVKNIDDVEVRKLRKEKVYSFQQMENVHIDRKPEHSEKKIVGAEKVKEKSIREKTPPKEQSRILQKFHEQFHKAKEDGDVTPTTSMKIQRGNKKKLEESQINGSKSKYLEVEVQTEKEQEKDIQKEKQIPDHVQMEVSRVASTIKPKANQVENHEHELLENDNDIQLNLHFEPIGDQPGENILAQLKQSQPKEEKPHPNELQLEKQDYVARFNVQEYSKVYNILKSIQISLKSSIMNVQQILRCIKSYLEIIAIGNLDNIDEFDLPLHKKKIIKNSLFLERVAIIVLAFTYTTHKIKENLKYILNMITYSINNCLVLIKVLEETQIAGKEVSKKLHEDSAFVKSDRLAMKKNLDSLRNNNNVLMDVIQKLSKGEELFYENLNHIVKLISKSSLEQTFYSLLQYFSFFLCVSELDHMIPFLAVAPNPYLSPMVNSSKYTLVIDVMQIFCFGTKKSKTNIFRPYTQHFLTEMSQYYEIISFSPMFPTQIDKIIDMLDPKGHITHRLYKHHTINSNNQSLKSLDRLGRNLDEMVLLDNQNIGGAQSLQNCIHIPVWKGNKNDTILAELCPLLAMIALKRLSAQEAVGKVREQSTKNKKQGVKYISFGISLD